MNLEVVRSRAARGTGDFSSIGRFAESASSESERVAELVQALLELARPASAPVDLWSALRPMVVLQHAIAAVPAGAVSRDPSDPTGAAVTLAPRGDASAAVSADPIVVRLALAAALESAVRARTPALVDCSIAGGAGEGEGGGSEREVVAMLRCAAPAPPLDAAVREAIEHGGVVLEGVPDGMKLYFRAAGRD